MKYVRGYVTMNVQVSPEGFITPTSMIWEDGTEYGIEYVKRVKPVETISRGEEGLRYTVLINGEERHFYTVGGRWFTPVPVYNS